ncbi:S26 family signal peptidase [Actinopolyspora halophila]|uniref:S26 family signal peptidase n=1 Tax=Actinopolyspora halophila TaxID=1850 RepID=UPI0003AA9E0F
MSSLGRLRWRRLRVRGASMAPTLRDGDIVLLKLRSEPAPGEVVLVRWSSRPEQLSVKRAVCRQDGGWHVTGDHTEASTDSRKLGPAEVLGVLHWRLVPRPGRIR